MIFESRLYREEFLRWSLVVALTLWGLTASLWAASKKRETLLIAISESGARVIPSSDDSALKSEATEFLKTFLGHYFNYSEATHREQIGKAADLMSADLWDRLKSKLLDVNERLKTQPLTQKSEIESIDRTGENAFESVLQVDVRSRMKESKARVKVSVEVRRRARTRENPWALEVVEIKDELL